MPKHEKQSRKQLYVYHFNPVFPHPSIRIDELQPAIVDGAHSLKKGDAILISRFDVHDSGQNKDVFTLDICTVISFNDDGTINLFDDTRGDCYGIDPKNPPKCALLSEEHLSKTFGKKKRKRRKKNEEQAEEEVVAESSAVEEQQPENESEQDNANKEQL